MEKNKEEMRSQKEVEIYSKIINEEFEIVFCLENFPRR